jgi:hypothetical protein
MAAFLAGAPASAQTAQATETAQPARTTAVATDSLLQELRLLRSELAAVRAELDSLRAETHWMRVELDSLRLEVGPGAAARGRRPGAGAGAGSGAGAGEGAGNRPRLHRNAPERDPIARLRAAAAAAVAEAPPPPPTSDTAQGFVGRQRSLQAFNPEISVGGDLFALSRTADPNRDNVVMRELELGVQAVLDPFSRAKVIAAVGQPGTEMEPFPAAAAPEEPGGLELGIEEAYVQWVDLVGGMGLTAGRFRQRLGTYNRWHAHALPWQQLPLPYTAMVGDEGLAQTGVSLHWLLPLPGKGSYETWVEVTRSGNDVLFGGSGEPSVLGHFNAFWDLSLSSSFEVGVSGVVGRYHDDAADFTNRLVHLEAAYTWRPPDQALYRGVTLRGALLWNPLGAEAAPAFRTEDVLGGYGFLEWRLSQRWLVGMRGDYVEDPARPDTHAWAVAPTLTWWQSEFVRVRGEYNHIGRSDGSTDGQLLVQLTFAMGPHKHEIY